MIKTALRRLFRQVQPVTTTAPSVPPRHIERPAADWIAAQRRHHASYVLVDDSRIANVRQRYPDFTRLIIERAERVLAHEFELLGSGPFKSIDPERVPRQGYTPIDWYLDPVRQLRFPRGVHHKDWKLYEMRPGNADVKYPWELARCQHWVTLGQAWRLARDPRFFREIVNELDDFMEANPVGVGVNWTCTMDVAIRAVNWVIAIDLIRDSDAIGDDFLARGYGALFEHGVFIRDNLENTYEVTSNHFLSNVLGLWFLGAAFTTLPEGRDWCAFAREALETEIGVQVLPDGADFESSVPYHRLVAELFLGALRLGDVIGRPLSDRYRGRVQDMVAYLADVTRPDGLMPQAGDADDGRLHVMTGVGQITPQDGRHLLGPAAAMFGRPDWAGMGGDAAAWEAAWWGLDVPPAPDGAPTVARLYPDAGHAIARDSGHYLLITNSIVGTNGFGNHKHNDQLSFEYHVHGRAIVVDPGSYVYTSDPEARNAFRGTRYHNTIAIDGIEQNEFNPDWLFRMFESANAEHLSFAVDGRRMTYAGCHAGYARLRDPVVHERQFEFDGRTGGLEITDRLRGEGTHELLWHLHFAPDVRLRLGGPGRCVASTGGVAVAVRWDENLTASVVETFYSPSYGIKQPCVALELSARCTLTDSTAWTLSWAPEAA